MQKSYIGKTHGRTMWLIEVLCNQKGCPIVLWIKGLKVLTQEMTVISKFLIMGLVEELQGSD